MIKERQLREVVFNSSSRKEKNTFPYSLANLVRIALN